METEENLRTPPIAHPKEDKPIVTSRDVTRDSEKAKEPLGARNSDLEEIDSNQYHSNTEDMMTDIRSKYCKKFNKNEYQEKKYHGSTRNLNHKTPKTTKSKLGKSKSKVMSSTPKLYKPAIMIEKLK